MPIIVSPNEGTPSGNAIDVNATQLQGVDISATVPTAGDLLTFDGTEWTAEAVATALDIVWGDIGGTLSNQTDLQSAINAKANTSHSHAQSDIQNLVTDLAGKASTVHNHDDRYYTETETDTLLTGYSQSGHNHDSRYYTETETNALLNAKQATLVSGTNIKTVNGSSLVGSGDVTISSSVAWGGITGTLSNQTDLQNAINAKANLSHSHEQSDITNLVTDLAGKASTSHTHTVSQITDFPSIPNSTGDLSEDTDKRYVTDAQLVVIGNTSGTNTGDQTDAQNLTLARIGNPTFSTVQHLQDVFHSAGWTSGGAVTDGGSGTVNIAAGTGLIRATNSDTATIKFFDFPQRTGVTLTDNSVNYIYVEYNAGTPQAIATAVERTDYNTNFPLAIVYRSGTTVHINERVKAGVSDHAGKMIRFNMDVMPYAKASGGMVAATGTRNFEIAAGAYWHGLNKFTTSAFNSATGGTFTYYYRNGSGGWTSQASQTQINNTQYDNNSGTLATLSSNKYGVHWVYQSVQDAHIDVVFGQGDYTLTEAQDASAPATLPPTLPYESILVAKIIIQKSASAFTQIQQASHSAFSGSVVADHNNLAGLQGGTAGEYYHLTSTDYTNRRNTDGLKSATTTVNVSSATAPTSGQVLTATSSTAATWQTPSAGSANIDLTASASSGTSQTLTLAGANFGAIFSMTGNCTFTLAVTASSLVVNRLYTIELDLTQDGTGSRTITFSAGTGATLAMPITSPPISATATTGKTRITLEALATTTSAATFMLRDLRIVA